MTLFPLTKKRSRDFFLGIEGCVSRVVELRLKARAQAFGHPHYQLVTSKVEIFQDDLLTSLQLTI